MVARKKFFVAQNTALVQNFKWSTKTKLCNEIQNYTRDNISGNNNTTIVYKLSVFDRAPANKAKND